MGQQANAFVSGVGIASSFRSLEKANRCARVGFRVQKVERWKTVF